MGILAMLIACVMGEDAAWGVTSTWQPFGAGTTDWLTPTRWNNGVPNAPGDVAILRGNIPTLTVPSAITLGELQLEAPATQGLMGPGSLTFDNAAPGPALLRATTPRGGVLTATIGVPMTIADTEGVVVEIPTGSRVSLNGPIVAGAGGITKTFSGTLSLGGANPNWNGPLHVEGGFLELANPAAVAGTTSVSMAPFSTIRFLTNRDLPNGGGTYNVPSLVLNGATLTTTIPITRGHDTNINTSLELAGMNVFSTSEHDRMRITGPVAGSGGMDFRVLAVPNQTGVAHITIAGPTSYEGMTIVNVGARVEFTQGAGLGGGEAGTIVRGQLQLNGSGGGTDAIVVERGGQIYVKDSAIDWTHNIHLRGAILAGGSSSNSELPATVASPVTFEGSAVLGPTLSTVNNLVLAGGLQGTGSVAIQNQVAIENGLSATGNLYGQGRDVKRIGGRFDLKGHVYHTHAALVFDGITEPIEADLLVSGSRHSAILGFETATHVNRVTIDPRFEARGSTDAGYGIWVNPDAAVTIAGELEYLGGQLTGAIKGQEVLTKRSLSSGWLVNTEEADFETVRVEAGPLTVRGGGSFSQVHLLDPRSSRLHVDETTTWAGDVFLNNIRGSYHDAAMVLHNGSNFAGRVFLGESGASISGDPGTHNPAPIFSGSLHGGDVTIVDAGNLRITGGTHEHTGTTTVYSHELALADGGRFATTNAIVVHNAQVSYRMQRLLLDNGGSQGHNDRIGDSVEVVLHGAELRLKGRTGEASSETIGSLTTINGASSIVVDDPAGDETSTTLYLPGITRAPAATFRFDRTGPNAQIFIAGADVALDDDLIGGWALYGLEDFATYGPNGVEAYGSVHAYHATLATATAQDNVKVAADAPALSQDVAVNSLFVRTTANLGGHTLSIESGGLILRSGTITGGRLTRGGGGELFVSGPSGQIAADIVDGENQEMGVIYSSPSGSGFNVSGNNTYSGTTTVNFGTALRVQSATALPEGGDLTINGGRVFLDAGADQTYQLGQVAIRDRGILTSSSNQKPTLDMESLHLEAAEIHLDLNGNFPIVKTGPGIATFGDSLAGHTGSIRITEGRFQVYRITGAVADDVPIITVEERGELALDWRNGMALADRLLRLEGGRLTGVGDVSADIEVAGAGYLDLDGEISGNVLGSGKLTIDGTRIASDLSDFEGDLEYVGMGVDLSRSYLEYDGRIDVRARRLELRSPRALGTGEVVVHSEGGLGVFTAVTANLQLNGGRLEFGGNGTLAGKLMVRGTSLVYAEAVTGGNSNSMISSLVTLEDGAELRIVANPSVEFDQQSNLFDGRMRFTGDIQVNGDTVISAYDGRVTIESTIVPLAPQSILRLKGTDTFVLNQSVKLQDGNSLEIVTDLGGPLAFSGNKGISGNGTLVNDVILSGGSVLSPGNSPGILTIDGDLTMTGGSRLAIEIGGTTRGVDYDTLFVTGALNLENALLDVSFINGFTPMLGDTFSIVEAGSLSGRFANLPDSIRVGNYALELNYGPSGLAFTTVRIPEPATAAVVGLLVLGLMTRRLRGPRRDA